MEKLDGKSFDVVEDNISKLKEIFPDVFTEGNQINFDELKELLEHNADVVDDSEEYYNFTWWGKKEAKRIAKESTTKTLRPSIKDSKNWDSTENIYIEGDNLEALKILLGSYRNSIKLIYIDPPYNTGKDFVYKDNRTETKKEVLERTNQLSEEGFLFENAKTDGKFHSNWLNMIYPRLYLARKFLTDDGCILISIDDNENVDLKKICDDIFGADNFISQLIWKSKTGGANDSKFVAVDHEYVLVYAKNIEKFQVNNLPYTEELLKLYNSCDEYFEERGPYRPMLLMQKGLSFSKSLTYPIEAPDGTILRPDEGGAIWRWSESVLKKRIDEGYVEFIKRGNEWKIYTKQYLKVDYDGNKINRGKLLRSVILDYDGRKGIKDIQKLFDEKVFSNPKPVDLIKLFISVFSNENDIIMDFFSGSATTADAILNINKEDKSNRKFILIQIPESIPSDKNPLNFDNICEIGKERIRQAGNYLIKHSENKDLDIGFKVFKIDESSFIPWNPIFNSSKDIEQSILSTSNNIVDGRSELDLIYELLLKELNMDLNCPIEEKVINNHKIYVVDDGYTLICLDSNIDGSIVDDLLKLKEDLMTEHCEVILRDDTFNGDDELALNIYNKLDLEGVEFKTI